MASRKKHEPHRNNALAVLTKKFGNAAGWEQDVLKETAAAELAEEVYALRERHGLTQLALARLIDSSQSAIARMEDSTYTGHSISVLRRMAAAVGEHVSVRFVVGASANAKRPRGRKHPSGVDRPAPTKESVRPGTFGAGSGLKRKTAEKTRAPA